jgi:hypothetical protein
VQARVLLRDIAVINSRSSVEASLRAIYNEDAAPVNLRPSRWQLDNAGWLSLQLLLRIWIARRRPQDYPQTGDLATDLPRVEIESAPVWWSLAIALIDYAYKGKHLFEIPELSVVITSTSPERKARTHILDKLSQRFHSLVWKQGGY